MSIQTIFLVLLLLLGGAACMAAFRKDRKKNLTKAESEITDILSIIRS